MEDINFKMKSNEIIRNNVKYNETEIHSVMEFAKLNEPIENGSKAVCFVRALGAYDSLLADIAAVDTMFAQSMNDKSGKYIRRNLLPRLTDNTEIEVCRKSYEEWVSSGKKTIKHQCLKTQDMEELAGAALNQVAEKFRACTAGVSASMEQNFVIKLMYWLNSACSDFFQNWDIAKSYKFIYSGSLKKQEYLYCYFLTFFGIDVLMIQTEGNTEPGKALENLSKDLILGDFRKCELPEYCAEQSYNTTTLESSKKIVVNTRRADRDERTRQMQNREQRNSQSAGYDSREQRSSQSTGYDSRSQQSGQSAVYGSGQQGVSHVQSSDASPRRELKFEELALLASSIVMITIHDKTGKPLGSGSGIMINEQGYILTNNHVACQGNFYSVRIEGDDKSYQTDEMIKYNQLLDLAIIRIDRTLQPVPFYQGEKPLVRGQKVVAIGSPLGLFNSVSDGIISGFRNIDDVDMIQFTAPISKGSSGGAVFNMYGEVIGISTAIFDYGQNINLAVGYEYINTFIRGFYKIR